MRVERPTRGCRARRQGIESAENHLADGIVAAGENALGPAAADQIPGVADGICSGRTGVRNDGDGTAEAERIHNIHPQTKIIILSMHASEEYVAQALKAGASGYLLKDAATAELEMALKSVSMGQFYLSPAISRQVVDNFLRGGPTGLDLLTPRQREILQLIAEGKGTREIAETLHLSVKTVETHRAQLMERLDIHDVAGLIRYALRKGLISADG